MGVGLAFVGFGEAGRAFAPASSVPAFDIDPARSTTATLAEALKGATAILSVVTADQAPDAAQEAAGCLTKGALYFDMNSVSPETKKEAAAVIEAAGGRYVDVAVMSPVHPEKRGTPLFVSGPHNAAALDALSALGFTNVRPVGDEVGQASSIKMIRSVMIKGIEALTAEMIMAARAADVETEVLISLGGDWTAKAAYNLERMQAHGRRRAAEMVEVAKTLEALGVVPVMTNGTIVWQQEMAA
ncbi:MAG: NAD(P)-dependent oxidoreductase [Sphingomonadaceae bacterium]|nr:NAD(P)-dependent oxidoreductase [Sphingomonadaceae bacterium]